PRVLVPRFPGGLSALGILRADVAKDLSETVRVRLSSTRETRLVLEAAFSRVERHGMRQMQLEGFSARQVRPERWLALRYVGQAYELTVPEARDFAAAFHNAHERRYGYADPSRPIEVVNIRVRLVGRTPKPTLRRERGAGSNRKASATGLRRA